MEQAGQALNAGRVPVTLDYYRLISRINIAVSGATYVQRFSQHFRRRVGNVCRINELVKADAQLVDGPSPLYLLPNLRFSDRSFRDIRPLNKDALGSPISAHDRLIYEVNV